MQNLFDAMLDNVHPFSPCKVSLKLSDDNDTMNDDDEDGAEPEEIETEPLVLALYK